MLNPHLFFWYDGNYNRASIIDLHDNNVGDCYVNPEYAGLPADTLVNGIVSLPIGIGEIINQGEVEVYIDGNKLRLEELELPVT